MRNCKAFGVMVIPYWESALFWPLNCECNGRFKTCVQDCLDLPTKRHFPLPFGSGMFGNQNLKFRIIVLKLCFEEADGS